MASIDTLNDKIDFYLEKLAKLETRIIELEGLIESGKELLLQQ